MKSLKLQFSASKFDPVKNFLQRYKTVLFVLIILAVYGFLAFRIGSLTNADPSEAAYAEKVKEVKRTKIDQSAIDKIQQLKSENVQVQTLFEQARDNPFKD